MKKINYIFSLLALTAFIFTSCEDTEELYPRFGEEAGQSSVAFTSGSFSTPESTVNSFADGSSVVADAVSEVTLVRRSADISGEVTVNISFSAVYLADNEFVSAGEDASDKFEIRDDLSNVTFEANSATASFMIVAIDDLTPTGDVAISFAIESVSDGKYQIGEQSGNARASASFTIIDDDCPIDIPGDWEGVYEVTTFEAAPGSNNEGFAPGAAPGLQVMIALDPSDPLGKSAFLQPTESNSLLAEEIPLAFETCPQTVLIGDGFYALTFSQNNATAAITRSDEPFTYGNGTFNPDGSELTLVVTYSNANGSNFDEFLITLERVEE